MKSFITKIILISLTWTGLAHADSLINVEQLNQKLQKLNMGWVAKDNSMNHLTRQEAKRFLGLKNTPATDIEFAVPASLTKEALPSIHDWRNKDGKNWVSPILNQANCGSCVAFASIGVMETQLNISSLIPNLNMRLSTQNLFACGGGGCESGWYPESAASYLMKKGTVDEACMPYTSGATGQDVACRASCSDANQRNFKISNYNSPTRGSKNVEAVKKALQKGPLMTTLMVYADFMTYSSGVYKHTTGEALGGHAISIVGYDDQAQAYIIRNSWGHEWGEDGFGRVAYSDNSGVGQTTWGFDVPATTGSVYVENPRDYNYISGTVDFKGVSTYMNSDTITMTVFDQNNKAVWSASCQLHDCTAAFDSTQLVDGRYEIQTVAQNFRGENIGTSIRQFFYVVNQKPNMSLSFTGNEGTDLSKPVKGRIEFKLNVKSSSVPMSSIEFHYKDAQGVEKSKAAQVVIDQMTMGWRTNLVPNGIYEVWFVGHIKTDTLDYSVESAHSSVTTKN